MGGIRLFLACGVFFLHFKEQVLTPAGLPGNPIWLSNLIGGRAVIFFYIVSGFLISYGLNHKYPQSPSGIRAFYHSRFLRIYPLWWVVLLICVLITPYPWTGPAAAKLAVASVLIGSDWIVAFWHYPVPYWSLFPAGSEIGWTLGAELAFYLLAPWVLRSHRFVVALFIVSLAVRAFALSTIAPEDPAYKTWSYLFFPSILVFFLLGHMAEKLYRSHPIGLPASVVLLVVAAVAAWWLDNSTSVGSPWFHVAALCFAAALPGVFAATKDSRVSNFLGNLTYPLYLTHSLVISEVFSGYLRPTGASLIAASKMFDSISLRSIFITGSTFVIALCVAAATHVAIELRARAAVNWLLDSGARTNAALAHVFAGSQPPDRRED